MVDIDNLTKLCIAFRNAIEKVSRNNGFKHKNVRNDRMNEFPYGCCDDTCDLLAYHLQRIFGLNTIQRSYKLSGFSDEGEYFYNHNVLVINEINFIIDLTSDQLGGDKIYIGPADNYPFANDVYQNIPNYDISDVNQSSRLFDYYRFIINELN